MGMTIAEKIIAAHCARDAVTPGEIVQPRVDMVFGNELGTGLAIHNREKLLRSGVFDRTRVAIIPDHFTPNKDLAAAGTVQSRPEVRERTGIEHYFEVGRLGIEHVILHEKGLVSAGEIVVGADSHTCTYGAMGALAIGVGSTDFLYAMLLGELWLRVPETVRVVLTGICRPI
jgi:3-isopropylmalate/(R)-2-methylmalate dehydratase large subunit